MKSAKLTDSACTCCCVLSLGVITFAVGGAVELLMSPVSIPVSIVRNNKYKEMLQNYCKGLSLKDRTVFLNELETTEEKLSHAVLHDYARRISRDKLRNGNDKRHAAIPEVFRTRLLYASVPPAFLLFTRLDAFIGVLHQLRHEMETQNSKYYR